ncbi:MAG: hypothetical protein KIH89_002705 [Candidatus Shapirobacteria bacterium]|nr:hypothetical protein [Candidatus Shapirobacteria bacterium]
MSSQTKLDGFSYHKNIIERQILNTLDFLFTDHQITPSEVSQISQAVLAGIDSSTNTADLFKNLRQFVNQYPLFKNNLQKTITALNNSYAN